MQSVDFTHPRAQPPPLLPLPSPRPRAPPQDAPTTKGCGLVTMGSAEEAAGVIEALNGQYTWDGFDSPMVGGGVGGDGGERAGRGAPMSAHPHTPSRPFAP